MLRQNLTVAGCLVEHIDIVRVLKDVLDLTGGKQVFDILRDTCRDTAPFSETLPDFHGICGGLLLFEKKVHFVDIVSRGLSGFSVDRDSVPHLVLHDKHTDFLELFTQLLNVVGHDTALNIHVGSVVEHIERTGNVDFKCGCDIVGFLFVLLQKLIVQVLKDRHFLRLGVCQIVTIDKSHTTVDNRFLYRL